MVYSFYDPNQPQNSLGTYMILDHIDIACEAGLPYIYLGYWVPGSPKMGYKAKFSGLEAYIQGEWQKIKDPNAFCGSSRHPLSTTSDCRASGQYSASGPPPDQGLTIP